MKKRSVRDGLTMLGIVLMLSGLVVLLAASGDIFSAFVPVSLVKNASETLSSEAMPINGLTIDDPLGSWPENSNGLSSLTSHQSSSFISSVRTVESAASLVSSQKAVSSSKALVSSAKVSSKAASTSSKTSSKASSTKASSAASAAVSSKASSTASSVSTQTSSTTTSSIVSPASSSVTSATASVSEALAKTVSLSANGLTSSMTYAEALKGMVGKELSSSYQDEAVKAQIVACNTFLHYYADRGQVPTVSFATPANLTTQWGTTGVTRLEKLIQEVGGKLMTLGGKPIMATYCAMSAGKTNNSTDVWSGTKDAFGNPLTYLVTVDSHWDEAAANFITTPVLTSAQLKTAVQTALGVTLTGDPSSWLKINTKNTAGYVLSMNLGTTTTTGRVFRENVIGSNILRSAAFEFTYSASTDSFTFTVKGFGHGVGMSQIGAGGMAKEGSTWQDILKHYYTGVTIE